MKTTYKAISQTSLTEFNRYCTDAVQKGFHPIGGIVVTDSGPFTLYTQAFIYYERAEQ